MTAVEKVTISFQIRKEIKEALQKRAKSDRRSLSSYVELALEEHVAVKKKIGKRK